MRAGIGEGPRTIAPHSPVGVEALQLSLHGAADAPTVGAVEPTTHHTQPVVSPLSVEGEVLDLGCQPLATAGGRDSTALVPRVWGREGPLVMTWALSQTPPPHTPVLREQSCALTKAQWCSQELTGVPARRRGTLGKPIVGWRGSSWLRVGGTRTRHQAWSPFLPGGTERGQPEHHQQLDLGARVIKAIGPSIPLLTELRKTVQPTPEMQWFDCPFIHLSVPC